MKRAYLYGLLVLFLIAVRSSYAERMNVLFISVDDLRPELGVYGSRAKTPNIDRLAASGLRFDRAYCNQAVCGASRVSLMTGLYPEYTKERTFGVKGWRERHPDVVTLNQLFKDNGYQTIGLGKIYHNWSGEGVDPENWTEWVKTEGVKYADPASIEKGKAQAKAFGKKFKRGPTTEAAEVEDDVYHDGWRAQEGAKRIKKLAKSKKPFFFAVGFTKPHLPFNAPKKYWDLYKREDFAMPANSGVPPGYPSYARNAKPGELRSYSDVNPESDPTKFSEEMNQRLIHGYHACVSYLDRNVGVVLEALEESGAADNTIIVFWGDHGWKLGDHSSWCKHTNLEVDTRVPLIIHHPKMATAVGESDALVELIDLYPTLAELCGLEIPEHVQGRSLKPLLLDTKQEHRDYAYSSYPHRKETVIGHSIRNRDYRYTEWWDAKTDERLGRVATNLTHDPGETTNVLEEQPKLGDQMASDLMQLVLQARKATADTEVTSSNR